ncbi:MAG: hypothetical protein FWG36_10590 [Oscillospiraceae bacterium]|nr:hypothetical protein [Oscillospiraceae bacterium]
MEKHVAVNLGSRDGYNALCALSKYIISVITKQMMKRNIFFPRFSI